MLIFRHFVYVTFLTTFTTGNVIDSLMSVHKFCLDGKVSDEHLLFRSRVSFHLECAATCMWHAGCVAFSTSPPKHKSKKVRCRGHHSLLFSKTTQVAGSMTYVMERNTTDEYQCETESTWLKQECENDSDCPATVSNVTCFADAGQCLCQPGYYYSHSRDDCVADCAPEDLQPTLLKYPMRQLPNSNLDTFQNCRTVEKAQEHCLKHPGCRAVDMNIQIKNCLLKSNGGTAQSLEIQNDVDHYQRTCL